MWNDPTVTNHNFFAGARLSDFYIRVGNDFDATAPESFDPSTWELCHHQMESFPTAVPTMFPCDGTVNGRFLTLHFSMSKQESLTVCEVEVFGDPGETQKIACVCESDVL